MTDSSGAPSDIHPSETTETQFAQADDAAATTEPQAGDTAAAEPAAGGADQAAADAPAMCEIPDANVVDVPVPAPGERIALAVAPGDVLRLACSFRDVSGVEEGDTLAMTFPGGGVVVVENFSAWVAAQGASVTDCVCGGVNLAEFVVALGLNPTDVLPAAGAQGGAQSNDFEGSGFTPGPGPQLLTGLPYPNILPPTGLGYGLPDPRQGLAPADDDGDPFGDDLGGPLASAPDPLTVAESTRPLALQIQTLSFALTGFGAAASADGGEGCAPPIGPVEFAPDQDSGQIFTNDDFGPDGKGEPPLVSFTYTGTTAVDDVNGVLQPDGVTLRITSVDPLRPWHIDVNIDTGLATVHLTGAYDHTGENSDGDVALETFEYTIQDRDGDTSSTQVTVQIVDSVPVAHDDCEVCIVEPGAAGGVTVGGNVMANDDRGADQFLPEGTDLISFTYDNGTETALVPEGGSTTVTTAIGGTLTVHFDGEWTYTPPASVDNSDGDVHDNFTYTIRDGDGDISAAVQPICIHDGAAPVAYDNKQCVDEGAPQNVVIIADVSGSMDDDDLDPDTDGKQTRLELEKEALTALVETYAALGGTVTITLIAFASGAGANQAGGNDTNGALNLGTFTFGSTADPGFLAAIAAIASLAIGMNGLDTETEYDDALILAQQVLQGQLAGQADGTENTVYFLSDGQPNPSSNGAGATGWKAFVNANGIEVIAVGMGGDIAGNAGAIAELAKVEDNDDAPIIVADGGDLAAALVGTVTGATVSGNVLTDPTEEAGISPANDPIGSIDGFGADGAAATPIISLTHDGSTYTKDSVGGAVLANDGAGTITIQTALGGTLQFNFLTGAYTYTAPLNVDQGGAADIDERFTYVIQDGDGDTDPADLVICIKDDVEPPQVTLAIGAGGQGGCVEEDSLVDDPDNQVAVHANAQGDDALTQLVITGFDNEPGWTFDFDGLKTADVDEGASDFDASDGAITIVFKPGTTSFDGSFGVQPPADTDLDLGTLTAVATAAAAGDPGETLSSSTTLDVTVDANADPVTVSLNVNDSGDAGDIFQQGETGTVQVTASFGDVADGSETHTVLVTVPDGFTPGALDGLPAGVTAEIVEGNDVLFTVAPGTGGFDYSFAVTNSGSGAGTATFTATATASENPDDVECDSSEDDNIATAVATENEQTEDSAPVIDPENAVVEEDDLPGGIDENPGITDVAANVSLGLDFGAGGAGDVVFAPTLDGHDSGQTSGGASIVYQLSPDGHTLTGIAGGETVFTVTLDPAAGTYTFDLQRPVDHASGNDDEESLPLTFDVVATDADGDPATASFTVDILNDVPKAEDDTAGVDAKPAVNIVLVFDRSGSMDEDPGVDGFTTRIDLARAAIASLLQAYGSIASLNILVVPFNDSATNSGWLTGIDSIEEANAYLAALDANGETNYQGAINETMAAYGTPPEASQSVVYFLSDGKPLPSNTSLDGTANGDGPGNGGANLPQTEAWEQFLIDNGIAKAFAVGIGQGVSGADVDLGEIAFPDNDPENPIIIVSDEDAIFDALIETILPVIAGNVLANDAAGGDGPGAPTVANFVHDGAVYDPDSDVGGTVISNNGIIIVIATAGGGTFELNFDTGAFKYTPPLNGMPESEVFTYTIQDADGDSSANVLTIDLDNFVVQQPNRAFGTDGADTVLGDTNAATDIDIIGGGDGNDSLSGGAGNDHISGGAGADTIIGGDGDDIIIGGNQGEVTNSPGSVRPGGQDLGDLLEGGAGDDFIIGNEGDDTITGGTGNDTIDTFGGDDVVRYTSTLDGHDMINNFDANGADHDTLDLSRLFDSLEATLGPLDTAAREARVDIQQTGNVATVSVNIDGDADFELTVATLNLTAGTVQIGTDVVVDS